MRALTPVLLLLSLTVRVLAATPAARHAPPRPTRVVAVAHHASTPAKSHSVNKLDQKQKAARRAEPAPRVAAKKAASKPGKPTKAVVAVKAPHAVPLPEPVPAGPEPKVTHNRKVHHTVEGSGSEVATLIPASLPALYVRGRLVMPAPLKGSHEILVHQNEMADSDGLARIEDDDDLLKMRQARELVPIPVGVGMVVDERLPVDRRYCREWTGRFLMDVARAHYARFHTPLQVNSAVRTVEFQNKLLKTNGNAAPSDGEVASPHLTGQAVDIAKRGLPAAEIAWMRAYLLGFVKAGTIDVEEEFQQACFHISVYRRYMPSVTNKKTSVALAKSPVAEPVAGTAATVNP